MPGGAMADTAVAVDGLLRQLRDGSDDARRELLARAYARLEHLARGRLRAFPRADDTGDVLHDVLLRLDAALKEVLPGSPRQFFALAARHIRWVLLDSLGRRPGAEVPDVVDPAAGPATNARQ